MTLRPPSHRWWVAAAGALVLAAVILLTWPGSKAGREQKYFCWDEPSTGTPAKYVVAFDAMPSFDTTGECVRVPPELPVGQHVATVRAVDAYEQASPTASLEFSIR